MEISLFTMIYTGRKKEMKIRSSKNRVISIAIAAAIISTCTIPNVIAESRNDINEPEQTISNSQEEVYITGEIAELRSEYSKTYEQSDGSRIAVMSAAPICFYDEEKEEWKEYDNRLNFNEETETFESEETGSDMQVSLPKNIDEENDIEVKAEGYKVSITPINMNSSSAKKTNEKKKIKSVSEKSLKKYSLEDYVSDSVLDGKVEYTQDEASKVEYIFSGSGLKENIILSEAPINKQTYSFRIKADGLTAKLKKDNTIKLLDKDEKAVFVIPTPYMYDSNFSFSDKIKTTLKKEGTEYILTYKPDYKWLTDEERAYPVTIDPTVDTRSYTDKIVDTSVMSALSMNLSKNSRLFAGAYDRNTTDSYIKFTKLPHIDKKWIVSNAVLYLKTASEQGNKINAYKVNSDWDTSSVIGNRPSVESKIIDVCSVPSKTNKWVHWDITNVVNSWCNGEANYGIKLSAANVTNSESAFYSSEEADSEKIPFLAIKYNMVSAAQRGENKTVDISRAGKAEIDDFSGNLVLSREDIGYNGKVMPVNISMIYNLNNGSNPTFGFGFKTNYTQTIKSVYNSGKLQYYEYVCGDGSTIFFNYNNIADKYIDMSGSGYTIKCKDKNKTGYDNLVVIDSGGKEHHFEKYGRVVKIVDTSVTSKPAIEIKYNDSISNFYQIEYIIDGVGRKYKFNYSGIKLTDISYYGKKNTVIQKVSYEYDSKSNLTKVKYPDGKSVSYSWNNHDMISVCNTDGYTVKFSYSQNPKRLSGIKEYGTAGTKGADISIEYTPYQIKYINNNTGDTETKVFNNSGDLISSFNSKGDVTLNEYSKNANGLNSLVNTYEHTVRDDNLLENGEFENGLQGWSMSNDTNTICNETGHCGSDKAVKLIGEPNKTCSISQSFGGMSTGETFEVGGWAKANASPQNPFNITVTFYNAARVADVQTIKFNPYCTDWQYVIKTFKADIFYTHFVVSVNYSNQINEALFDGIVVYKSDYTYNDSTSVTEPDENESESKNENFSSSVNSDNSVTETIKKDDIKTVNVFDKYGNNLRNETSVDGKSVLRSNEYTDDGNYPKSSTDSLGFKTSYSYDLNTGYLNSITNADGSSVNYSYDNFGKVQKVSQGTAIENSFSYDSGDRLSKITHNDFDYDIGYTEFGLLKSIKAGNGNLINYSYDSKGALIKADYGNGQSIDYKYNENGSSSAVKQGDETLYSYKYDKDGNLKSVQDNFSNRKTEYSTDKDGYRVTEETGSGVYHKIYCTNEKLTEIIGEKEKTLQTDLGDNSYKIYWTLADDIYSTYFNAKDKFGRKSKEGVYAIYRNANGKEVELSKKEVYNKEYKYISNSPNRTSELVSEIKYTGAYNNTIHYGYDGNKRISEVNDIYYTYDEAGHLTTEVNVITRTGVNFVYDKGGNVVEVRPFSRGRYGQSHTFTYGDPNWKDLLTAYNGNEITYDEIGNPLTYYNGTEFNWTMGQKLKSAKRSDGVKIKYIYNADGLRTSKTINNVKFDYYWNDGKLSAQTYAGNIMYFRYDGDTPIGFEYNNSQYYYVTDLLGSIIAVLDAEGKTVAEYSYDAWGNCTVLENVNGIANTNPLRYRGYYYDSDTGLYCIQSRYYDSKTGRYINANSANAVLQGELNLFEYDTNPMKYVSQQTTDLSGMGSGGKVNNSSDYYDVLRQGSSTISPPIFSEHNKTYDALIFSLDEFIEGSEMIKKSLENYFKRLCGFVFRVESANEFKSYWNSITYADVIVLFSHAGPDTFFNDLNLQNIRKLKKVNCKALIILGCNAGHYTHIWNNIAYEFSQKISGITVASDGTVGTAWEGLEDPFFNSYDDSDQKGYFRYYLSNKDKNRKNLGWVLYKSDNVNTTWYQTNLKFITIPIILDYLQNTGFVKF